jgi:hypothetical protein
MEFHPRFGALPPVSLVSRACTLIVDDLQVACDCPARPREVIPLFFVALAPHGIQLSTTIYIPTYLDLIYVNAQQLPLRITARQCTSFGPTETVIPQLPRSVMDAVETPGSPLTASRPGGRLNSHAGLAWWRI